LTGSTATTVSAAPSPSGGPTASAGPLALYRALASDAARWRSGPLAAGILVFVYLLLRTVAADAPGLRSWLVAAVGVLEDCGVAMVLRPSRRDPAEAPS